MTFPRDDKPTTQPHRERPWIPDEALEACRMERSHFPEEDNRKASKRLIQENLPVVIQSMVHLAVHSTSERIRLDAGKYLTDRGLGRASEEATHAEDSPITSFLSDVLKDIDSLNTTNAKDIK